MLTFFEVALTADFFSNHGQPRFGDLGLDVMQYDPKVRWRPLPAFHGEIQPESLAGFNAVLVLTPKVTAHTVAQGNQLLAVARFGVGFDSVDVPACTSADVAVIIAAGAVNRSVAEATVTWMLALTHRVRTKDSLVREGRWHERDRYMGSELRDRTLGVIGLGGIGRALVQLLAGFAMCPPLAFDPLVNPAVAGALRVRLVDLPELLRTADFVSIHCPLNEQTRNLIGAPELALMKPTAYLLNTARGGIVDEDALYRALQDRRIAGAALDCFLAEPIVLPHRFGTLDNVLLAPHAIAWTEELFRDIGRAACGSLLALVRGERPAGLLNPEVLDRPGFQQKWTRIRSKLELAT
jgi:phosphoglycerate dehydrogenase-like enzyme